MSWCRFSTILDSGDTSDLYIYESVDGGVAIHIAERRIANISEAPKYSTEDFASGNFESFFERQKWLENNKHYETIGLPYDGQYFNMDDPKQIKDFLIELKDLGYLFPDYVFEYLQDYRSELLKV